MVRISLEDRVFCDKTHLARQNSDMAGVATAMYAAAMVSADK
jgi:hypothetical protein